jgi:hypothetical protein
LRTADVATFPYPTRYALHRLGVSESPAPYLFRRDHTQLVRVVRAPHLLQRSYPDTLAGLHPLQME